MNRKNLGGWGEERAWKYLINKGVNIIYRNFRCSAGEIDLIGIHNSILIFFEVKTRTSINYGYPSEAVDKRKINRYIKSALFFIKQMKMNHYDYRFDIIEIMYTGNDNCKINHISNAFQADKSGYYL